MSARTSQQRRRNSSRRRRLRRRLGPATTGRSSPSAGRRRRWRSVLVQGAAGWLGIAWLAQTRTMPTGRFDARLYRKLDEHGTRKTRRRHALADAWVSWGCASRCGGRPALGARPCSDRDVAGAERCRERPMWRAGPYENRARRVDAVCLREGEQPRERRTAPAGRWAGVGAGTVRSPRARRSWSRRGRLWLRAHLQAPSGIQSNTRQGAAGSPCSTASSQPACRSAAAATKLPERVLGGRRAHERHPLHGEAFVSRWRPELAERAHLGARRMEARLAPRQRPQLLRVGREPALGAAARRG